MKTVMLEREGMVMRIVDLLKKESIQLNAVPKSKDEAIEMLVELQVMGGSIADREA